MNPQSAPLEQLKYVTQQRIIHLNHQIKLASENKDQRILSDIKTRLNAAERRLRLYNQKATKGSGE